MILNNDLPFDIQIIKDDSGNLLTLKHYFYDWGAEDTILIPVWNILEEPQYLKEIREPNDR